MNRITNKGANLRYRILILAISLAIGSAACAVGRVSDVQCKHDAGLVDGEPDYGVTVSATVENVGEKGSIYVGAHLSTSEGTWDRRRDVVLTAGESRRLSFFFPEPSINAADIQCDVTAF